VSMAFPIDVSKPFRYPSELIRMVDAVRRVTEYDETRWIEWKSTLDLANFHGIRHLARQVLGFANREPRVAANWAGGYAYLVVGASPGQLKGVSPIDTERITSQVQSYVGGEVVWTPEYITLDKAQVLVVIVEPPREGDPIHVLRRDLDPYKAGAILIRRHGQTVQADPSEMAMLQRRLLKRSEQIEISVEPRNTAIEAVPGFASLVENWARRERDTLLPASDNEQSGFRIVPQTDFIARVDAYLQEASRARLERAAWQWYRHDPAKLAITLMNNCDRNFSKVAVQLTIRHESVGVFEGDFLKFVEDDEPKLPRAPKVSAAATTTSYSDIYRLLPGGLEAKFAIPKFPGLISRGWIADKKIGTVYIQFDSFDLRPGYEIQLPAVPLMVNAHAEDAITVGWVATATNANGVAEGSFDVNVVQSTLSDAWLESSV